MRPTKEEWYIGIEAGRQWMQISCYHAGLAEPETKSTLAGSEMYLIPTAICKRKQSGQWCFGEEGRRLAESGEGYYAADLLKRAFRKETVTLDREYAAEDLLGVFFRKLLRLALPAEGIAAVTKCVFSLEKVTEEAVDFLQRFAKKLGFTEKQIQIQDHRESFYAYVVSQEPSLWNQQVLLLEEEGNGVYCRLLSCNRKTEPMVVEVGEAFLGKLPENHEQRDMKFAGMVKAVLAGRIVTAAYLIGSGFEGDWMKDSLQLICRNRRAFQGKNLYTKGACYAGLLQEHKDEAKTVYFGDYKVRQNIMLGAVRGEVEFFYTLVEAGSNRHQVDKELRILLEGGPMLEIWLQEPGSKEARIESLELTGLEVSGQERNRLLLHICGGKDEKLLLKVQDLGWGQMCPSRGQEWSFEL